MFDIFSATRGYYRDLLLGFYRVSPLIYLGFYSCQRGKPAGHLLGSKITEIYNGRSA